MYTVRWRDLDDQPRERRFDSLESAHLEALDLASWNDPVTVTRPDGSCYAVR